MCCSQIHWNSNFSTQCSEFFLARSLELLDRSNFFHFFSLNPFRPVKKSRKIKLDNLITFLTTVFDPSPVKKVRVIESLLDSELSPNFNCLKTRTGYYI